MSQSFAKPITYVTSASGAPTSIPTRVGETYINTATGAIYMSMGTDGPWNWALIGQGSLSSFSATTVGGLVNWWKADSGVTYDGGNAVSQWNDSAASGDHVIQSTAISKPIYTPNTVNGYPAIYFDGSNDWLSKDASCTIVPTSTPITIFIVALTADSSTDQFIFSCHDNGGVEVGYPTNGKLGSFQYNAHKDGPAVPSTSSFYLITCVQSSVSGVGYVETNAGADRTTNNATSAYTALSAATYRSIGRWYSGSLYFKGYVAEILGYSGILSDANISIVKAYLNNKYALY